MLTSICSRYGFKNEAAKGTTHCFFVVAGFSTAGGELHHLESVAFFVFDDSDCRILPRFTIGLRVFGWHVFPLNALYFDKDCFWFRTDALDDMAEFFCHFAF